MSVSLEEIIKADVRYCKGVGVVINRGMGWVTIRDREGEQEDIFLQGDEACEFIGQFDALTEQAPNVLFADALKHLAKPYVETIWH